MKTSICPACQHPLPSHAQTCPQCGAALPPAASPARAGVSKWQWYGGLTVLVLGVLSLPLIWYVQRPAMQEASGAQLAVAAVPVASAPVAPASEVSACGEFPPPPEPLASMPIAAVAPADTTEDPGPLVAACGSAPSTAQGPDATQCEHEVTLQDGAIAAVNGPCDETMASAAADEGGGPRWTYVQSASQGGSVDTMTALLTAKRQPYPGAPFSKSTTLSIRRGPGNLLQAMLEVDDGRFLCDGGCTVQLRFDQRKPVRWRARRGEALQQVILQDPQKLVNLLRESQKLTVGFDIYRMDPQTTTFDNITGLRLE